MIETISHVLTWAVCGGILLAVAMVWIFVFARIIWFSIRRRRQRT